MFFTETNFKNLLFAGPRRTEIISFSINMFLASKKYLKNHIFQAPWRTEMRSFCKNIFFSFNKIYYFCTGRAEDEQCQTAGSLRLLTQEHRYNHRKLLKILTTKCEPQNCYQ